MRKLLFAVMVTLLTVGLGSVALVARAAIPDTITVGLLTEPNNLDPGVELNVDSSKTVIKNIYESLVDLRGNDPNPKPLLASRWTVSSDGRIYDFTLRQNIQFTDGTPFDAAAVKANIDRIFRIKATPANFLSAVDHVEVAGSDHVRFVLKAPFAVFLGNLVWISFVSPKAFAEHNVNGDLGQGWLRDHAVGTGPYTLDSWIPGQIVVLRQNKAYWGGWSGSHLKTALLRVISDPGTQRLMLERGDIDIALLLSIDDAASLSRNPDIVMRHDTSFSQFQLMLNTQTGPMKDRRVREALADAFDYDGFIKGAMRGAVTRAYAPYPPEMTGGLPGVTPVTRNLARAKDLLNEAGFASGFAIDCKFITGVDEANKGCQVLQASVAGLGIRVNVSAGPWPTLLGELQDESTAYAVWPFYIAPFVNSPDTFLYPFYHSSSQGKSGRNLGYYSNPQVDRLLDDARAQLSADRRRADYREAGKIIASDFPAIYINHEVQIPGFRTRVKGYQYNPLKPIMFSFYEMYVE
jgi:peptide/nickel transport system substrate-binding protein